MEGVEGEEVEREGVEGEEVEGEEVEREGVEGEEVEREVLEGKRVEKMERLRGGCGGCHARRLYHRLTPLTEYLL